MKIKQMLLKAAVIALWTLLPSVVTQADPVLTLSNPSQTGFPGSTVNFFGTIRNGGGSSITVDSIFASLSAFPEIFTVDVEPFFSNPGYDLSGSEPFGYRLATGASTGEILLFSVVVDPFAVLILDFPFPGTVFVTDSNGSRSNVVDFDVAAAVPEPATLLLLSTGLAGAAIRLRRRHQGLNSKGL